MQNRQRNGHGGALRGSRQLREGLHADISFVTFLILHVFCYIVLLGAFPTYRSQLVLEWGSIPLVELWIGVVLAIDSLQVADDTQEIYFF